MFSQKHHSKCFGALLIIFVLGTTPLKAEDSNKACLEKCTESKNATTKQYEECLHQAQQLSDPLAVVKRKQDCRKRFPTTHCEGLAHCPSATPGDTQKEIPVKERMQMGTVSIYSGTTKKNAAKRFRNEQTVTIEYELLIKKGRGSRFWFDQDLVIYDKGGNEMLQDSQAFERSGEMVSSYQFKSSFTIPKEFQPGDYKLKLQLRERYTQWESEYEEVFTVVK